MKYLSSAGIAISLVSCFLFLALTAQVYYLLWWKKKRTAKTQFFGEAEEEESVISPGKELLYLFCWKKPSSLSSTALNPQEMICTSGNNNNPDGSMGLQYSNSGKKDDVVIPFGEEEGIEAELMRVHSLSGPPRFLFTIKEETKEDLLESEDGRSRKNSRGKSLSGHSTPYLTPLSSPPLTPPPIDYYSQQGFNPLFESFKADTDLSRMMKSSSSSSSSPPPKFKFLRDAEEKLYKKILREEAMRVRSQV